VDLMAKVTFLFLIYHAISLLNPNPMQPDIIVL